MNKAQRVLALAGMGFAAGAMIGMGPAQAAPSATPTSSGGGSATRASDWGDEHVVGYYRTEWSCERAGWTGKRYGAWYDYDCDPVRYGWRGWVFRLVVDEDDWEWDDWRGSWPGDWPYRPDYAGRPFHIRGDHGPHHGWPHGGPMGFPPKGGHDDHDWHKGKPDGPDDLKGQPPKGMPPKGPGDKVGWPKP
ncbi:hypothetical protein GCM10010168_36940 [Actinoplanes ianthinogenes]|uniref:Uncharacterized protein n=1 Tax=Actinoplanes ianthinogenes TaxID=122358 RepID=A0ABM7M5B4_9ACTN|nr:hypothetical protein [Actinoplanes ianthinogenes]BCJ46784.1 hypothetical protein Aiant_74410 [Actinoplanes ianthinogenes]GGR15588.1 hypothetical protein GCM10010168_36940 [Actinoplanes ianthinogenes]